MYKKAIIKTKIWVLTHLIYLVIHIVKSDPDLQRVLEHSNIEVGKGMLTVNETDDDEAEEAAKPTRSVFDDLED